MTKQAPVILQLSDTECGIACLAMAMAYYKYYVPIETLRDQCGASRDGCKAQTLIDTATMHGFEANAYRIEIDDLKDISHPVIAHWSFRHYIVINDIKKNYVSINDPACGVRRISIAEFNQSFTGIIISISPTNQVATNKRHHTFYKSMMPYLAGSYSELTFLVTCLLTYSICIYMRTSIYSIFINQYFVDKNNDSTIRMIFLTFIVSFIYITSSLLHKLVQFKANIKKSTDKMSEIISHLLKLPIVYFALRQRSEIIATVFKSEAVFHSVIKNYSNITSSLLVASIIFSLMIIINSSLTISVSIFTFCYILFFLLLTHIINSNELTHSTTTAKLHAYTQFTLRNIETVKAASLEQSCYQQWHTAFLKMINSQFNINKLKAIHSSVLYSYPHTILFTILILGYRKVIDGQISLGSILTYYSLQTILYSNLMTIMQGLLDLSKARPHHARINDILIYEQDHRFYPTNDQLHPVKNSNQVLSCENLAFSYSKHAEAIFSDINIKIYSGQHIALIGPTGSGKSTLVKTLCGLHIPSMGILRLFNNDIAMYGPEYLSKLISYVSQDIALFSGTIYQNLTLWNENITLEVIYQAIETACLDSFIKERGLHAIVEENGRNLSGGERQRIEIARALIQNTPILVLDEATSALDNPLQTRLINNLQQTNKTIIYVAHRLASIQHCDQIIFMQNGKITEQGSHTFLMSFNSQYRHALS